MTSTYSPEARLRAATALVLTGNSLAASKETGIPGSTLRHWSRNDIAFQSLCEEVWCEYGATIKANLAQIVKEAGVEVLDRIRNGDVHRDSRTGELFRLPMRGREIAIAGAIAFDKLRLAESQPTSIVKHEDSKTHLQRLAEEFAAISQESQG